MLCQPLNQPTLAHTYTHIDIQQHTRQQVFGELPIDMAFPLMFGGILCPMVGLQAR